MEEEVRNAILKVALGCSVEEVTEEYGVTDGELTLVKRQEARKDIRPISKPCAFSWKGRTLRG